MTLLETPCAGRTETRNLFSSCFFTSPVDQFEMIFRWPWASSTRSMGRYLYLAMVGVQWRSWHGWRRPEMAGQRLQTFKVFLPLYSPVGHFLSLSRSAFVLVVDGPRWLGSAGWWRERWLFGGRHNPIFNTSFFSNEGGWVLRGGSRWCLEHSKLHTRSLGVVKDRFPAVVSPLSSFFCPWYFFLFLLSLCSPYQTLAFRYL